MNATQALIDENARLLAEIERLRKALETIRDECHSTFADPVPEHQMRKVAKEALQ